MARLRLYAPLLIFLALAALFWRGLSLDPNAMPSALVDQPLPHFNLKTLENDKPVTDADLIGGVALINVWATWCPTCHVEHPFLNMLAQQGVVIYGINYKDDATEAKTMLAEKGSPYRFNIADTDGLLGIDLGVTGAPETYLIDAQGVVHYRFQGALDESIWLHQIKPLFDALTKKAKG